MGPCDLLCCKQCGGFNWDSYSTTFGKPRAYCRDCHDCVDLVDHHPFVPQWPDAEQEEPSSKMGAEEWT